MNNKKITINFCIFIQAILILLSLFFCGCNKDNKFEQEQNQIEATIQTQYQLIAVHNINNTISFTNVLDKKAEIQIMYTFNNNTSFYDIVVVNPKTPFKKTYTNGYSIATFSITILSLS